MSMRAFLVHALVAVSLVYGCASSAAPAPRTDADTDARAEPGDAAPFIELGASKLLTANVQYRLRGADLVVISHGAGMRSVLIDDDPDKEDHVFFIDLEVVAGGKTERLEVTSRQPATWGGYRFVADPDGFTWGRTEGAIVVERVR
jgi:hypothetical protein